MRRLKHFFFIYSKQQKTTRPASQSVQSMMLQFQQGFEYNKCFLELLYFSMLKKNKQTKYEKQVKHLFIARRFCTISTIARKNNCLPNNHHKKIQEVYNNKRVFKSINHFNDMNVTKEITSTGLTDTKTLHIPFQPGSIFVLFVRLN